MEEWRAIPGWEGFYEVSNLGRVRRLATIRVVKVPARILKPAKTTRGGYVAVDLQDKAGLANPRHERHLVHRLVCRAFHGEAPSPEHEVAHGDGNGANSVWTNLRWATRLENAADKERHGTQPRGSKHGMSKLTEEDVIAIRNATAKGHSDYSLAKKFGVTPAMIGLIRKRKNWRHI